MRGRFNVCCTHSATALAILCMSIVGCQSSPGTEARRSAAEALHHAEEKFAEGDYAAADGFFTEAMEGELTADGYTAAGKYRVTCLIRIGDFEEALEVVEAIRPGLLGDNEYHRMRSVIYKASGNEQKAAEEYEASIEVTATATRTTAL